VRRWRGRAGTLKISTTISPSTWDFHYLAMVIVLLGGTRSDRVLLQGRRIRTCDPHSYLSPCCMQSSYDFRSIVKEMGMFGLMESLYKVGIGCAVL
jgi:hypothetical protein